MGPCQRSASTRRYHKSVFYPDKANILDPLLWLNGKNHALLQRFIKSLCDNRGFIDPQPNPMPEEFYRIIPVSHEPFFEFRSKSVHDVCINLRGNSARSQKCGYFILYGDTLFVDTDCIIRNCFPKH